MPQSRMTLPVAATPFPPLSFTQRPADRTDWMDSSNNQSLDDYEMGRLVSIAAEEFGLRLTRSQFNDVVLALFEHIAGLETIPTTKAHRCLGILWSKYQQAIQANGHRH